MMLRRLVLGRFQPFNKGFPIRARYALRRKIDEYPVNRARKPSTVATPKPKPKPKPPKLVVREPLVLRRSRAQSQFGSDEKGRMISLVKTLRHVLQEWSLSSVQRSEITSVVIQLERFLEESGTVSSFEGTVSEAEKDAAAFFMNRVCVFNDDLATFIDSSQFCNEHPLDMYYLVRHKREEFSSQDLRRGLLVCSVPLVYNTLLRLFAKLGRSREALEVLEWIAEDGLQPDFQTYLTVLESMGHANSRASFEQEKQIVERLRAEGHALEDLLLVDDYEQESLHNILRVVFRVEPRLQLKSKTIQSEEFRYKHFPVLKRYCESEISKVNPLFGVMSKKELLNGYQKQAAAEKAGSTVIKPIAELKVDVSDERRKKLHDKLLKERELWRATLTFALRSSYPHERTKGLRYFNNSAFLYVLPEEEYVEIMLQEADYLVSETVSQFSHVVNSHRRLGDRVYQAYLQRRRLEENHDEKLSAIYAEYMPRTCCNPERDPNFTNLADIWETVSKPHLKGSSLTVKLPEWSYSTCIKIGFLLHRLMYTHLKFNVKVFSDWKKREEAPVIYESVEQQGLKLEKYIRIHPVLLRWFKLAGLPPLRFTSSQLPMLCPPMPWVSPERQSLAGFLFSQDYASKLIRLETLTGRARRLGASYMESVPRLQYSPVLDALNLLSAVAWRVNQPVLDAVTHVFQEGSDHQLLRKLGLPPPVHELPEPPPKPDPRLPFPERQAAMMSMLHAQKERAELFSMWCTELYRLSIANKFRNDTFWLPHSMDFRGRVYPCPPLFNYMGSDVSRSILTFAKGRPLGRNGLDWLLIHLVNLTGLKKRASNAERLAFANSLHDEIIDSAERPLDGRRWWLQEDDPWQVLACCKEIAAALKSPDHRRFVSHLPVHQDGSCNGLQHYAALGRDKLGADCVNLLPRDSPQDVYADVGELVERRRAEDAAQGVAIAQQLEGYVKRKVIKQSVMTTVYGVTLFGAQQQIARQLKDYEEFPPELIREASTYLGRLTLSSIGLIFTSSVKIQDWLVDSARAICSRRKVRVAWKTPLGLPVMQPYTKEPNRSFFVPGNTSIPDTAKQARAFPPNYVHSLDATHMMLTALSCYRAGITFAAVHDCFWTHAADVEVLNAVCRDQFVALHEQPLLQDLAADFLANFGLKEEEVEGVKMENNINDTFRAVPSRGDLNIKKVLESEYFFS